MVVKENPDKKVAFKRNQTTHPLITCCKQPKANNHVNGKKERERKKNEETKNKRQESLIAKKTLNIKAFRIFYNLSYKMIKLEGMDRC